ncbi:hypothetical protein [Allochromatium vinosum]|uniref:hypothetical protein n=1 Tax=Allochromatium vinosum TaxID=1049 RepID=UPI0019080E74|nr:hypothetical protein [Allochromatium vinosum]MBK1655225.1 hypothetical protein [Allochromatium vinosum]
MDRLHIFRAGCYASMSGTEVCLTAPDLLATAGAYDPARHQAPLVLGHPTDNAPAHGWVSSLIATAEGLFAEVREVSDELRALVETGRFKKLSASFWPPEHPENPAPGVWSLRHIGFLGAAVPAVLGLDPPALAGCACGSVELAGDPIEDAARRMAGLPVVAPLDFAGAEDRAIEHAARRMAGLEV